MSRPAMFAGVLAIVAILAHYAPEHVAAAFGGTQAAWSYVGSGIESAVLWCVVGLSSSLLAVRAVSAWGAFESVQRFGCRLAFPMDKAPPLANGQTLCQAATGIETQWFGFVAALFVAALLRETSDEG